MRKIQLAAVIPLVFAGSLIFPQSASAAGGDITIAHQLPRLRAAAWFKEYGDELRVCDTDTDGMGAWAGLYDNSSHELIKSTYAGGSGNCKTNTANVREGRVVYIKLCLRKDGENGLCLKSNYGYA